MSAEDPPFTLDSLTDDLLSSCLALLEPVDLINAELACQRFRSTVLQHELWRRASERIMPSLSALEPVPDTSQLPHPLRLRPAPMQASALFKRFCAALAAPDAPESLLSMALAASSTDNVEEHAGNVLNPITKTRRLLCYWSSKGSPGANSSEMLSFRLVHPLCLVRAIQLRPFRAWFQPGQPLYASQTVRIRLGVLNCFEPDGREMAEEGMRRLRNMVKVSTAESVARLSKVAPGQRLAQAAAASAAAADGGGASSTEGEWRRGTWTSAEFPVDTLDEMQTFPIPPALCIGGYLSVELIGRTQRQEADDAYYTCLAYVRAVGTPLYNFILRTVPARGQGLQLPPWQLVFVAEDPGVRMELASEYGRMAWVRSLRAQQAEEAQPGQQAPPAIAGHHPVAVTASESLNFMVFPAAFEAWAAGDGEGWESQTDTEIDYDELAAAADVEMGMDLGGGGDAEGGGEGDGNE